ncbi:MAG: hypothetical protein QW767_06110 [Thermoprotei archaeon]
MNSSAEAAAVLSLDFDRLKEFTAQSHGYTVTDDGDDVVVSFTSELEDSQEHFQGAVIRVRGRKRGPRVEIYSAEMDYGGGDVRKISVDSLVGWALSVDEYASF